MQLDACDKLGVPRVVSSVVVPVGATCHMDGACLATIYEIVLAAPYLDIHSEALVIMPLH